MTSDFLQQVDERAQGALASGDLQPLVTEQTELVDGGLRFLARSVSTLAGKRTLIPGGPRDPNFNPFLSPDPALTVGPLGDAHTAILNKFPISARHLVIATKTFSEQLEPLDRSDFAALARVLVAAGGLGFHNGGTAAGASQRHKHVQWIPSTPENAGLALFGAGLPQNLPQLGLARHPALPMQHCFVRVDCGPGMPVEQAAAALQQAWEKGVTELGLKPGADGLMPPYNMLAGDGWMLLIPRSQEQYEGISLSAICFGGTLYTRTREQVDLVQQAGPLQVLAGVGFGTS